MERAKYLVGAAVAALFFCAAGTALAADRPLPWSGGQAVESDFERHAAELVAEAAGQPVQVICNGETDWNVLASQGGFDPARVWGYVPGYVNRLTGAFRAIGYTHLSTQACLYGDLFWGSDPKPAKDCQAGTETVYQTTWKNKKRLVTVKKRVKVRGAWRVKRVRVRRTVRVPVTVAVQQPVYETCADYPKLLFAVQTLAHEAMHLGGVGDEAEAECYGAQWFAWFASKLGASPERAREMANDYWELWYLATRPGTEYHSSECRDGGVLDLRPSDPIWP